MAVRFLNLSPTGTEAIAVSILINKSKHNVAAIVSGYMLWFMLFLNLSFTGMKQQIFIH